MDINRNDIIDECIKKIEELSEPHCSDHTPYYGPCITCGQGGYTYDVLPSPSKVIEELEKLKTGQ